MRKTYKSETLTKVFKRTTIESEEHNPNQIRIDSSGRLIARAAYGNRNSMMGWNIHHIDGNPKNNVTSNLQAVNFETHKEIHENE